MSADTTRKAIRVATESLAFTNRPNACTLCGVFRLDGAPPTVHFTGCGAGPTGMQLQPGSNRYPWRKHDRTR